MSGRLLGGLTRHFRREVAVRLKVMGVVGYIEHRIVGAGRKESVMKMCSFGWGVEQEGVADVLFDVLVRAL